MAELDINGYPLKPAVFKVGDMVQRSNGDFLYIVIGIRKYNERNWNNETDLPSTLYWYYSYSLNRLDFTLTGKLSTRKRYSSAREYELMLVSIEDNPLAKNLYK